MISIVRFLWFKSAWFDVVIFMVSYPPVPALSNIILNNCRSLGPGLMVSRDEEMVFFYGFQLNFS
jgi:hypothetical protein